MQSLRGAAVSLSLGLATLGPADPDHLATTASSSAAPPALQPETPPAHIKGSGAGAAPSPIIGAGHKLRRP